MQEANRNNRISLLFNELHGVLASHVQHKLLPLKRKCHRFRQRLISSGQKIIALNLNKKWVITNINISYFCICYCLATNFLNCSIV